MAEKWDCPGSVSGHDDGGRTDGNCTWCGRRLQGPAPRPDLRGHRTELDEAYRRHYDPDYGSGKHDN